MNNECGVCDLLWSYNVSEKKRNTIQSAFNLRRKASVVLCSFIPNLTEYVCFHGDVILYCQFHLPSREQSVVRKAVRKCIK